MQDGAELKADIIITATGFNVQLFGGARVQVDGKDVDLGEIVTYRDTLYAGVPNMAGSIGYFNGSWTLKAELQAELVGRIIAHMRTKELDICVPSSTATEVDQSAYFTPGYAVRAAHLFPQHGIREPWRSYQNFPFDIYSFRHASFDHQALQFRKVANGISNTLHRQV